MDEQDEGGSEPDGRTFRTLVGDEWIETPATIASIREALPIEQRDEFTKTVEDTPARNLPLVLNQWARTLRPEIDEATRREQDRVEALALAAEARIIMGEDPDVVQGDFQSGVREGR
ncbi:hypothetical protein [Embleya scabrispora]|uniref:hypothetical protein n=1 Tax=Embleya scabrispora TaxID=159449 RepID=UPI00036EDB50|nr:hypothetical protein [Embleya scabrispora]MYS84275.1 hypothetical protein [Streptomyces sp. SID5474]